MVLVQGLGKHPELNHGPVQGSGKNPLNQTEPNFLSTRDGALARKD
jgi:hypothetical protein